jgi:RNA polymerase sigma-70 factor (ECF subfamily)
MQAMAIDTTARSPIELELVERVRAGDRAAFERLVELFRDRVYGLAYRMLNSAEDAAEVTQETFLSAYRTMAEFRGDSSLSSWLHRIASNHALMRLRRRKVASHIEAPEEGPTFNERGSLVDAVADWSRDAEGQTLDNELRQAIEGASAALAEEYRQVFLLRDVEGLSYEEIAQVVGDSVPAIKSRLHRARLSMRAAIDRFYQEREP